MKKFIFIIIIVLILIILQLFINNCNITQEISSGLATITGKEISYLNSKFEKFYGINKSEEFKSLLEYCIENYKYYHEENAKVPTIKYIAGEDEIVLEYEYKNISENKEETEYYVGLNKLLQNISSDKLYKIEFKYMERIIDGVSLINEIEIIEMEQ